MNRIDWGRVVLAGLAAGLVLFAVDAVLNSFFAAGGWSPPLENPGPSVAWTGAGWIIPLTAGLVRGVALVAVYAALRDRVGGTLWTAVGLGGAFWLLVSAIPWLTRFPTGFGFEGPVVVAAVVGLLGTIAAALVGALIYRLREAAGPTAEAPTGGRIVWGQPVPRDNLPELFRGDGAPAKHVRGQHPPAAVDNMRLRTVDIFRIPGKGEFRVPFEGYFQVTRSQPSTDEWKTATVAVNFTDLKLFGHHAELGAITVELNRSVVSGGYTFPAREAFTGDVACRIPVAARFKLHDLGMELFNKEPILLKNDNVQGIPTIGEGGQAGVFALPLYDVNDPNGPMVAYLEELEYMVLNYATKDDALRFRQADSETRFRELGGTL